MSSSLRFLRDFCGLDEERKHLEPCALLAHLLVARCRAETACRVEYFGDEMDIGGAGEKDPGAREDPMHGRIDVALVLERLTPCGACAFTTPPRTTRDRLNRLHGYVPLRAHRDDSLGRGGIVWVLHHDVTVRK